MCRCIILLHLNFTILVLYHFSHCSVHLTGNSQTHNAQSAAGSGGAKTKVDKYTAAEGSTALFTQVRCQTPGILARGHSKCYCNTTISENLSHLSVSVVFRPFVFSINNFIY